MTEFSYSLFKITQGQSQVAGFNVGYYPIVSPNGSGNIDIIKNFRWKNNIANNVDEVPYVILSEYSLKYGIWASNLATLLQQASTIATSQGYSDPYGSLYFGKATGFNYALPYLVKPGSSIRGDIKNTWSQLDNPTKDMLGALAAPLGLRTPVENAVGRIQGAAQTVGNFVTPGYGAEKIWNYSGTAPKSITITFPLYNTFDEKSALDNFAFVSLIAIQNLKTRTSYLSYIPPKIYTVDSYALGGLFMPVAFVSDLQIHSIGTTRKISEYTSTSDAIIIPEAYKVSITLTELLPESSNIMVGALGGKKLSVFNTVTSPASIINNPTPATLRQVTFPSGDPVPVNSGQSASPATGSASGGGFNTGSFTVSGPQPPPQINVPAGALSPANFNSVPQGSSGPSVSLSPQSRPVISIGGAPVNPINQGQLPSGITNPILLPFGALPANPQFGVTIPNRQ